MIRLALLRAAFRLVVVALLVLAASAEPARAHGQSSPLDADSIRVETDAPPNGVAFEFTSTDAEDLVPVHDPAIEGSALLVRGTGANAGRTPLISFDPAGWSATANGYGYADETGSRGGVTSVVFENGLLSIEATESGWTWAPAGAQDEVWVHFRVEDEWFCARFSAANATIEANQAGRFEASNASAPGSCPAQVCGNGVHELGEGCDDGNLVEGDGCDNDCTIGSCNGTSFDTTFEGIQKVIFESEAYGCGRGTCHDAVLPDGNLDLTSENAYRSLLGENGLGAPSDQGSFLRVLPNEPSQSLLFLKLASKLDNYDGPDVGSPMPTGLAALSEAHLEAVRLWIRGGAPIDLVVDDTAQLLGTCFPPPDPLKTPVPDAPPAEIGFQLRQTPYALSGTRPPDVQGETELCMATYYDLSSIAPAEVRTPCPPEYQLLRGCSNDRNTVCTTDGDCADEGSCIVVRNAMNPGNECIAYDRLTVIQDPQSHHSILGNYIGSSDTTDPCWGRARDPETGACLADADAWTYKFEPDDPNAGMNGIPCEPTDVDPALGYNPGGCSAPSEAIACIGYGPGDLGNLSLLTGMGGNYPQLSLSQEVYHDFHYPPGVYTVLPVKGVVVWNSHAFNLTPQDTTMAQFLNLEYAPADVREHAAVQLFDAQWIFAQFIEPYQQKEICATYTAPQGARLFQLSSHTHRHGTRWRTWGPPNTPCRPVCPTREDDFYLSALDAFGVCDDDSELPLCTGPRTDPPLYISSDYSDPLNKDLDPPMELDDPDDADRTFLYCSVFDNEVTELSPRVKRAFDSPHPPDPFGLGDGGFIEVLGGPCRENLSCSAGANLGMRCADESWNPVHALCDSYPGAGDGECDACPVHGGVTTEDEMFILLGSYYMAPEPGAAALGAASLAILGGLARRRRR